MRFYNKKALVFLNTLLIFLLILPASAENPMQKAKSVKREIASMGNDLSNAFEAYKVSQSKLEKLDKQIAQNTIKLEKTKVKLNKSQKVLSKRIKNMYRYNLSFLDVIFSAKSFTEMLIDINFITRISNEDAAIVNKVKKLREQADLTQKRLIASQKAQKAAVNRSREKKDYINAKLAKAKKQLTGLEKQIAQLSKPKPLPPPVQQQITSPVVEPAQPTPAKTNGQYAFPVGQPASFSNDWGAPRPGRSHQGNDILAPMGTPVYAVISGSIEQRSGRTAGNWISLHGSDGNTYWYMHLSSFAASGQVSTGQLIGYVGDTGDAAGGPPHVHFELHPGGGAAVNPYYFLTSIQ